MKCIPVFFAVAASFILLSAYKENNANRHPSRQNSKPNIIFILTDDQRWDALGFAGNPIIKTPNIDGLPVVEFILRMLLHPRPFVRQAVHPCLLVCTSVPMIIPSESYP